MSIVSTQDELGFGSTFDGLYGVSSISSVLSTHIVSPLFPPNLSSLN